MTATPTRSGTLFLDARTMRQLVRHQGLSATIAGIATQIEADFCRWVDVDKSARVACHSASGVIELMPIADAAQFSFKYEYAPQSRVEGEVQQLPANFPVTEFWQVLSGQHPGRRSGTELTVFDSVGFALEDFAALHDLHGVALALGLGERIQLVAQPADPKNLFGLLHAAGQPCVSH